jgi:Asp-tRNA(Asn)/Glu-tRNA(Gln) amidotransferase A subunit family amidase
MSGAPPAPYDAPHCRELLAILQTHRGRKRSARALASRRRYLGHSARLGPTGFRGASGCGITEPMNSPLTLLEAASAIRHGNRTPRELVADCLDQINRHDAQVHAWVSVDAAGALQTAEQLGGELSQGRYRGPLHGIPVGIKDLVDVAGMATRAGSPLTDPRPAARDATVVERLRASGAIILGKTVTTEFACFDPSPTRNPWNLAHTPGGSSSGSAAAVALGMCLGAIGSQTGGSITRPASYCGVAGCKPTFGRVSRAGVMPVSFHLDHVGPMARTAADCTVLLAAIAGDDPRDVACAPRENLEIAQAAAEPPRLGVIWRYFFDQAEPELARLTSQALDALAAAGAKLVELPLPAGFEHVHAMHRRLMAAELADFHRTAFGAPRDGYGPNIAGLLAEGFAVSLADYQEALRHQESFRNAMARTLAEVDALVTPATHTAAPEGLQSTGDPRFNSPWSHAGVPTVSIPCALTAAGLPISLQLVGPAWSEARLLAVATWCEGQLGFRVVPPMLDG